MKQKVVIASNNEHKVKEFKEILQDYDILTLSDVGFYDEIEENGQSFKENALIKARAVSKFLKSKNMDMIVIADDSGLCVNALNGQPGIYSARYSGEQHDHKANRAKLLKNLEGKSDRTAYFNCVIARVYPDGTYDFSEGKTYGHILEEEIGENGFGYDSLFYSDDLKKSFAQATAEEKNSVSHRSRAIRNMVK